MKTLKLSVTWVEHESIDDLDRSDRELVEEAIKATGKAYAPYSRFCVGAAVRLDNGLILKSTNVENAAFPSGICAERAVLAYAVSNFPDQKITSMAITAKTGDKIIPDPVTPCGNCRQVIAEEEFRTSSDIRIILYGTKRIMIFGKGGNLLPLQFNSDSLSPLLP